MIKHFLFLSFLLLITHLVYFQPARQMYFRFPEDGPAGTDAVNINKTGVKIGKPKLSDPNWCYLWTASPEDPTLKTPDVAQPVVNPEQYTTYTLTLTYKTGTQPITQDAVNVYVLNRVEFLENSSQKYAYDDGNYAGPEAGKPWKLVAAGEEDLVDMDVYYDPEVAKLVHIKSSRQSIAAVTPLTAASVHQQLTVTGISKGYTSIVAYCKDPDREVNSVNIASYEWINKSAGIRPVHELNDDVQNIRVDSGAPNQVAITTGADIELTTLPVGDDQRVSLLGIWNITTGADGICETKALGNDFQKIPVGKGAPNWLCVSKGENDFMDTPSAKADDVMTEEGINTGPNGICETAAKNTNVLSTHYNEATILAFLNNVYGKVLVRWTLTVLPAVTVNADLDRDGRIEYHSGIEKEAVIQGSGADGRDAGFDNIVLLTDNLWDENEKVLGVSPFGEKHCFVDVKGHAGKNTSVEWTVAHELGHAAFALTHPRYVCDRIHVTTYTAYDSDAKNLMDYCNGTQLRKFQWDIIHK